MSTLPAPLRDGRYRVVRLLGEGGQAVSFEARDAQTGRTVVVKRFRVRGARSWKEVELAEREARVLASVRHDRLPRYVEHFEQDGELFLVTEMIEGESLLDMRRRGGRLSEEDVMALLHDAADALRYLHGRAPPIVHRDIKPSNVLRRPDGSYAFIDFGSVRDRLRPEGGSTVVGTFGYMAPEQFQGRAMPASDVYAVGATALSMLTGREPEDLPHRGLAVDVNAALAGRPVRRELAAALASMLEPDPDRRPSSLDAALEPLKRARVDRRAGGERADGRRGRKRDRPARAGGETGSVPFPASLAVFLGLTIAQLAVVLALRVIVPVLLSFLSVFIHPALRRAARRVSAAGGRAYDAIGRARRVVTEDAQSQVAPARQRVRIDPKSRLEPDGLEEELEAEAEAEAALGRHRR